MKDKWIKAPDRVIDVLYKRAINSVIELVVIYIILNIVTLGGGLYFIYHLVNYAIKTINNNDVNILILIVGILISVAIISLGIWEIKATIKNFSLLGNTKKDLKEKRCFIARTNIKDTDSCNNTRYVIVDLYNADGNMIESRFELLDNYNKSSAGEEITIFKVESWENRVLILKDKELNMLYGKLNSIFKEKKKGNR